MKFKVIFVCGLVFLCGCIKSKNKKEFESDKAISIIKPDKEITLDSIVLSNYTVYKKKLDHKCEISYPFEVKKMNGHFFILSFNKFVINEFDENFNFIQTFGKHGKGPGEGLEISQCYIEGNQIVIWDNVLKNISRFHDGKFIEQQNIEPTENFPNNISSMVQLENNYFLCTGNNPKGWENIKTGIKYNNLFLIDRNTFRIDSMISIIPDDIMKGIERNDVISSPVSCPFRLAAPEKEIFLFNRASRFIYKFEHRRKSDILNNIKTIELPEDLFISHEQVSFDRYNSDKKVSTKWFQSGSNLANIFGTSKFIIFYITKYNNLLEKMNYELIFLDKETLEPQFYISYALPIRLQLIDNDFLFFFKESITENSQYEVYSFNYSKLL